MKQRLVLLLIITILQLFQSTIIMSQVIVDEKHNSLMQDCETRLLKSWDLVKQDKKEEAAKCQKENLEYAKTNWGESYYSYITAFTSVCINSICEISPYLPSDDLHYWLAYADYLEQDGSANMYHDLSVQLILQFRELEEYKAMTELGEKLLYIYGTNVCSKTDYPDYILMMADAFLDIEQYGKYREYIQMSFNLANEMSGMDAINEHFLSIYNTARHCAQNGNSPVAIEVVEKLRELVLQEPSMGSLSMQYANIVSTLGIFNMNIGNDLEARKLMLEAKMIFEEIGNVDSPDYLALTNNLLMLDEQNHSDNNSISQLRNMLNAYNLTERQKLTIRNNLCALLIEEGNFSEAKDWMFRNMNECRDSLGEEDPIYAFSLVNIANFYSKLSKKNGMPDIGSLVPFRSHALAIFEKRYGKNSPEYMNLLTSEIVDVFANGEDENAVIVAEEKVKDYFNLVKDNIFFNFGGLSKDSRENYWDKYNTFLAKTLPTLLYSHSKSPNLLQCTYDAALLGKGLLLNTSNMVSVAIQSSGDNETKALFSALNEKREKMASTEGMPLSDRKVLEEQIRTLDKELTKRSDLYNRLKDEFVISWKEVQCQLTDKDIALEFIASPWKEDSVLYSALVLRNKDYPQFIDLGIVCEKDIINDSHNSLSNIFWRPVLTKIGDVNNIYFSPVGILQTVPIESFPIPNSTKLLSDKYNLYRLSSTRELIVKESNKIQNVVLYGGITYDMTINEMIKDAGKYSDTYKTYHGNRGAINGLESLPGSKEEVCSIAEITKKCGLPTSIYTDKYATEPSFKSLSGKSYKLIHIATHAFYKESEDDETNDSISANSPFVEDALLSRCGLYLAGADNTRLGEKLVGIVDNGILDANEISILNLYGTDMVALSACETGLGNITGDGVFGLQRGFKKAGVQSILMSLWKVDDEATCLLMTEFYKNWISEGKTKHDALELAKQAVRSHKEKGWDDPKYWAAFILLDALD